ncbi:hypothetical protein HDV02_004596 [Globomyces sp. JEL0801]|nr:hypothetical protein HDV02_004596 [Globomyces sp. JEL0801]
MSSLEQVTNAFDSLSISVAVESHSKVDSFQSWVDSVKSINTIYSPTKTLLLKPSKSTVPVLVISLESSTFAVNPLVKSLGFKDARMAADDLVNSTFQVDKLNLTPFALENVDDKASVIVVLDSNIANQSDLSLAFRAFSETETLILSSQDLQQYLQTHGGDFKVVDFDNLAAPAAASPAQKKKGGKEVAKKSDEKEIIIGLTVTKEENFPKTKTEMLDYYDISGCYIIRPYAFAVWKEIQKFFGGEIEEMGVEDCYFPMFVTNAKLNKEKDHIEGFSPEVAWVTKAGSTDLAEPIAVRPTSETVMYPYYATWIRSHRDLPLRLNQWCNVVRWEFKFLWQEGHTAHLTKEDSVVEVHEILDLYRRVYEELLAVPVIPGKKSEKEKFAGGLFTTTVEGFIPTTGRAIQGATSHCLGQNFSKMFDIICDNEKKERVHVWQNSWGITTRTIGVMVMVHGLVLPPRVAQIQVVIVPCGITVKTTADQRQSIYDTVDSIAAELKKAGIRVKKDVRENVSTGNKFHHWELRGVPVRLEVGPKDMAKNEVRSIIRHNAVAQQLSMDGLPETMRDILDTIQADMFAKAKTVRDSRLVRLETWDKFVETLNNKCLVLAPWCEQESCEDDVKERSARIAQGDEEADEKAPSMGAKTLCIPFTQPTKGVTSKTKCFACGSKAVSYTLWGRSY